MTSSGTYVRVVVLAVGQKKHLDASLITQSTQLQSITGTTYIAGAYSKVFSRPYLVLCCEAVRSAILATAWLLVF